MNAQLSQADRLIREGKTVEECRRAVLDQLNNIALQQNDGSMLRGGSDIQIGDNSSYLQRAVGDALLIRAGLPVENPSPAARDFQHTGRFKQTSSKFHRNLGFESLA